MLFRITPLRRLSYPASRFAEGGGRGGEGRAAKLAEDDEAPWSAEEDPPLSTSSSRAGGGGGGAAPPPPAPDKDKRTDDPRSGQEPEGIVLLRARRIERDGVDK